ncbi:MAG: HlyD family efflux transporter periplasmic adaptor subunit [Deltaproteobacteria bacterium]|nr:HlyD family efflux transporter periplasmic adaptor subunit [Deltaproteobacteria bacterium]
MKRLALLLLFFGCAHPGDVSTVEVRKDDLVIGVEVIGELEAVDSTDIKPPPIPDMWDFKIAQMAAEGDEVKPGDPVIGFDGSEQMRELENMMNEADAAQKKLDKKRDDAALARRDDELKIAEAEAALRKASLKTGQPDDLVASIQAKETALDEQSAKLALDAAKQHAEAAKRSDDEEIQRLTEKATYAKHRVEELQGNIAKLQVTAPRAGTVVLPQNWQGEKHKVGDSVWRMEDVMSIVGLGKMVGAGQVDEVDIAKIDANQAVTLRLDALPDVQLKGHIESIAKSVNRKSQADPSKVIKLKIAIDPTKEPLRPGMRFRGQIETAKLPGVVQVPADAVFVTPEGPVAYRETGGKLEKVKLVLGQRNQSAIEVKQGLAPGDRVSRSEP